MAAKKKATAKQAAPRKRPATTSRRARPEPPAAKVASTGGMTVREAGRKGGLIGGKKGGDTVKAERGIGFYQEIGRKGGQKVRELIEAGRAAMAGASKRAKR